MRKADLKALLTLLDSPLTRLPMSFRCLPADFPAPLKASLTFFRTDVMALPTAPEDRLASAWICPELPDDALRIAASV